MTQVPATTLISLVRHGDVANPEQVYYGRLPGFALSALGREQAAAAGRYLRQVARHLAHSAHPTIIYHSPLLRARQTAEIIAGSLETATAECQHLIEIHSPFDGRPKAEMDQRNWDFYTGLSGDYEQPPDIAARMVAFFELVREAHPGEHVIGVTHADPVAFAVMWASGLPVTVDGRHQLEICGVPDGYPATASVTTFAFPEEQPVTACTFQYWSPAPGDSR